MPDARKNRWTHHTACQSQSYLRHDTASIRRRYAVVSPFAGSCMSNTCGRRGENSVCIQRRWKHTTQHSPVCELKISRSPHQTAYQTFVANIVERLMPFMPV